MTRKRTSLYDALKEYVACHAFTLDVQHGDLDIDE